jgi:hypothetical protein
MWDDRGDPFAIDDHVDVVAGRVPDAIDQPDVREEVAHARQRTRRESGRFRAACWLHVIGGADWSGATGRARGWQLRARPSLASVDPGEAAP